MNWVLPMLVGLLFTTCLVCVPACLSMSVSVYGQTHTGYTGGESMTLYTLSQYSSILLLTCLSSPMMFF